jgi:RNA polymerase sigma-70 factor (ECF subfamily)
MVIPAGTLETMGTQITELLQRVRGGDSSASDELLPAVYDELHRLAERHLRGERQDHTLQPTALVNEAYLRMFEGSQPDFADRAHFMALASRIMRRILVDYARARGAHKRGGEDQRVTFDPNIEAAQEDFESPLMLLDLDRAIQALATEKPPLAEVIEMHYFGGMTAEETAEVVGRTVHTVRHELRFAQAWLRRELDVKPAT